MGKNDLSWKNFWPYVGGLLLCIVILFQIMRLSDADLSVPFGYLQNGDQFLNYFFFKHVLENGWSFHNPSVGMPFGLDLQDLPFVEAFHFFMIKLMSLWGLDFARAINHYFLLTFPLVFLASLFVLRQFHISWLPAFVGSLLYTFLPYHFWKGDSHIFQTAYFFVPLIVMVILWIYLGEVKMARRKEDSTKGDKSSFYKLTFSILICFLSAIEGFYYSFFGAFLILVAGILGAFYRKAKEALLTAVLLVGVIMMGLLMNYFPTIKYVYDHGKNPIASVRTPNESEMYGLKIAQLLLPITGHRWEPFSKLKETYNRSAPLVNENDWSSLGIVGGLGFLFLIVLLFVRSSNFIFGNILKGLSFLTISALLFGTLGGFGSLFSYIISPQIRSFTRISIFIAFFALFAIALLLEAFRERTKTNSKWQFLFYGLCLFVLGFGLWDQTSPRFVPPYEKNAETYQSDVHFMKTIESHVPENSMIFQLPYMVFPEPEALFLNRMLIYHPFRGYLHSERLRWTYGSMKGREGDRWQRATSAKSIPELLQDLRDVGFKGIYVDRFGYPDSGKGIESQLFEILGSGPLVSEDQRLVLFLIN